MDRQRIPFGFFVLALFCLNGCVLTPGQLFQPARDSFPNEIYFESTGLPFGKPISYRLTRDGVLTLTRQRSKDREHWLNDSTKRRVTAQTLESFHRQVATLRLAHWQKNYLPRYPVFDGYFWKMRYVVGDESIISIGSNAGPDPADPSRTLDVFSQKLNGPKLLEKALSDLWEHSAPMQ